MKVDRVWHFQDGLPAVTTAPPLPLRLLEPLNSVLEEAATTRRGMEDFLDLWREFKYVNDPDQSLSGDEVAIHFVGDMVHVYALYDDQWSGGVEDAWFYIDEIEDMFRAYQEWRWGEKTAEPQE